MRLLVFNAGSSSLKFDLREMPASGPARPLAAGSFVDAADGSGRFVLRTVPVTAAAAAVAATASPPAVATLAEAAGCVLKWLGDPLVHGADLLAGVTATVHRIVHGGERFRAATVLDGPELDALAALSSLAPLHN